MGAVLVAIGWVPTALSAPGGPLPLYRAALLNVPAGKFEVAVFHRGALSESEEQLVNELRDAPKTAGANLEVYSVDLVGNLEERLQNLWDSQTNAVLPWLAVRPPDVGGESRSIWSGPLKREVVAALLDSPARRKIAEGLIRGDVAVWVLLECGDVMRDEAAVDRLSSELKAMETRLQTNTHGAATAIGFSLVRITQNDEAEELLINTLVRGDRGLRTKPAAYPVFGRGRILPALTGRHLSDEAIRKCCVLLTTALTNAVTNIYAPGRELLLNASWDAPAPASVAVGARTEMSVVTASSSNVPPLVSPPPAIVPASAVAGPADDRQKWIWPAVLCGVLVAAAVVLTGRRSRR